MGKITFENTSDLPQYVGGMMVLPGEARQFDEDQVPAYLRPPAEVAEATADPVDDDPLQELLSHKVKEVAEAIPDLSDDDLGRLGDLEQLSEAPRKTVLEAVADEILKRAEAKAK